MAAKNILQPTTRHVFDCSTLTGSYQSVAVGGFAVPLVIYKLYNASSSDVDISYNDSDDQDVIPAGGTFIFDVQSNAQGDRTAWPAGREMFVKGSATAGNLYEIGYSVGN